MEVVDAITAAAGGAENPTEPDRDGQGHGRDARDRPPPAPAKETAMTSVTIATEKGDIEVDLFTTDAPKAARTSSTSPRRASTTTSIFHRVIPGFVIQAGDGEHGKKASLNAGASGPAGPATSSRTSRSRATTSAARWRWPTPARTRTAASSSSATQDLTGKLPKNYTLFGQVTKGMDVVDAIVVRAAQLARTCRTIRSRSPKSRSTRTEADRRARRRRARSDATVMRAQRTLRNLHRACIKTLGFRAVRRVSMALRC